MGTIIYKRGMWSTKRYPDLMKILLPDSDILADISVLLFTFRFLIYLEFVFKGWDGDLNSSCRDSLLYQHHLLNVQFFFNNSKCHSVTYQAPKINVWIVGFTFCSLVYLLISTLLLLSSKCGIWALPYFSNSCYILACQLSELVKFH